MKKQYIKNSSSLHVCVPAVCATENSISKILDALDTLLGPYAETGEPYWASAHNQSSQERACQMPFIEFQEFFLFLYFFFDLSKIYVVIFFLKICHPAAGSFGGNEIPSDEPAVGRV